MRLSARQKRLLGIVVGEHSMLVAEVSCDRRAATSPRLAEFAFPDQLMIDEPDALGVQFTDFLTRNGFSATDVVIGVPAKQLVARQVEIPPTDPRTAAELLWLQTTAHFLEDLGPMVFDFAGETSSERATTVNLIGLQRNYLDRLLAFVRTAGLKPIAVHATISALAAATSPHVNDAICLSVRCDGAELALDDGSSAPLFKHVASTAALPRLLTELRRHAVANASATNRSGTDQSLRKLVLWNDSGLDGDAVSAISQATNMDVVSGKIRWLDGAAAASTGGAPLALLLPMRQGQRLAPDFLRPRIKAPKRRALTGPTAAICAAVAAVLIIVMVGYGDVLHIQGQIASTRDQLDALGPQLETARPFAIQMQFAKTFQPGQLSYLRCLKDLTVSIPQQSQTYLTSFMLGADMKGVCVGHSGSEQDALDLLDKLNATGRFTRLNRKLDARPKGKLADVLFTISFTYLPDKLTAGG